MLMTEFDLLSENISGEITNKVADTPMPKGMGFLDKLTSPILLSIKNLINYNI